MLDMIPREARRLGVEERRRLIDLLRAQVAEARAENPHDALQAAMSGKTFWEIA